MIHFSLILFLHKTCNELEYMVGINLYGMHLRSVIIQARSQPQSLGGAPTKFGGATSKP